MRKNEDVWRCGGYNPHDDRFARIEPHQAPRSAFSGVTSPRCRVCEAHRLRVKRARDRVDRPTAPLTIRQEPISQLPTPPTPVAAGIFPPGFVRPLDRLRARRLAERIAAGELIELREA